MIDESKQLEIIRLFTEESRSYREIAKLLGCHRNTVSKCIERYSRCLNHDSNDWIAKPKSKGKWDELLRKAEEAVVKRKWNKKIGPMDLFNEIRNNHHSYQSYFSDDELFSYSTLYLALRERNEDSID